MSELRWHPLLREWVITATERQERTFLPPKDYCPLCPTRPGGPPTEIASADFHVAVFENRFTSLRREPPVPAVEGSDLFPVAPAQGRCEVIVYTPEHDGTLADCSVDRIEELIYVWRDRTRELGALDFVKYVFIFENKGEAIGVTLHHPHGQIYAFPFMPPRVQRELDAQEAHQAETGRCLVCDIVRAEERDGRRLVLAGEHFAAAVPFYARFPYEVHVWARRHVGTLTALDAGEVRDLARVLKGLLVKYDHLWGLSMPYMMIAKQCPTDGRPLDSDHLRVEFYPLLRTAEKLKYLASVETGSGTFINDTLAEERAAALRATEPHDLPD